MLQRDKLGESRPDVVYLHLNQMKICESVAFIFILYW